MGYFAVQTLRDGESGVMVGLECRRKTITLLEKAVQGQSINEKELEIANVLSR